MTNTIRTFLRDQFDELRSVKRTFKHQQARSRDRRPWPIENPQRIPIHEPRRDKDRVSKQSRADVPPDEHPSKSTRCERLLRWLLDETRASADGRENPEEEGLSDLVQNLLSSIGKCRVGSVSEISTDYQSSSSLERLPSSRKEIMYHSLDSSPTIGNDISLYQMKEDTLALVSSNDSSIGTGSTQETLQHSIETLATQEPELQFSADNDLTRHCNTDGVETSETTPGCHAGPLHSAQSVSASSTKSQSSMFRTPAESRHGRTTRIEFLDSQEPQNPNDTKPPHLHAECEIYARLDRSIKDCIAAFMANHLIMRRLLLSSHLSPSLHDFETDIDILWALADLSQTISTKLNNHHPSSEYLGSWPTYLVDGPQASLNLKLEDECLTSCSTQTTGLLCALDNDVSLLYTVPRIAKLLTSIDILVRFDCCDDALVETKPVETSDSLPDMELNNLYEILSVLLLLDTSQPTTIRYYDAVESVYTWFVGGAIGDDPASLMLKASFQKYAEELDFLYWCPSWRSIESVSATRAKLEARSMNKFSCQRYSRDRWPTARTPLELALLIGGFGLSKVHQSAGSTYQGTSSFQRRLTEPKFAKPICIDQKFSNSFHFLHGATNPQIPMFMHSLTSEIFDQAITPWDFYLQNSYTEKELRSSFLCDVEDANSCSCASLLHIAAAAGRIELLEVLLAKGANPNAVDEHEHGIALSCAAARGHLQVVNLLLDHGAFANFRESQTGLGPLHHAVMGRCPPTAAVLIERGAVLDISGLKSLSDRNINWLTRMSIFFEHLSPDKTAYCPLSTKDTSSLSSSRNATKATTDKSTAGTKGVQRPWGRSSREPEDNDGDDDDDDKDRDDRRRKKRSRTPTSGEQGTKPYYCHFDAHPDRAPDKTPCKLYTNLHYLRAHILSTHVLKECPHCRADLRHQHLKRRFQLHSEHSCASVPPAARRTNAISWNVLEKGCGFKQLQEFDEDHLTNRPSSEKWARWWTILFPGTPQPDDSPWNAADREAQNGLVLHNWELASMNANAMSQIPEDAFGALDPAIRDDFSQEDHDMAWTQGQNDFRRQFPDHGSADRGGTDHGIHEYTFNSTEELQSRLEELEGEKLRICQEIQRRNRDSMEGRNPMLGDRATRSGDPQSLQASRPRIPPPASVNDDTRAHNFEVTRFDRRVPIFGQQLTSSDAITAFGRSSNGTRLENLSTTFNDSGQVQSDVESPYSGSHVGSSAPNIGIYETDPSTAPSRGDVGFLPDAKVANHSLKEVTSADHELDCDPFM